MHPWLLAHPPLSSYGACIVAAVLVAWAWARTRARRARMDPSRFDLLVPILVGMGLAGAWIFGRLTDALTGEPSHSAVLVGSLLVATTAGIAYALVIRLPLGILGDIVAPPLALGIGVGRIGCFLAGCCFGKVNKCPTAVTSVRFPPGSFAAVFQRQTAGLAEGSPSLPVYPVQLYECFLCIIIAVVLWRWRPRDERGVTGQKFLLLGLAYAEIRFCLEFLRADNPPVGGLTFSQWGSLLIAAIAGATWLLRRRYAVVLNLRREPSPDVRQIRRGRK